jgi:hypothetical protein
VPWNGRGEAASIEPVRQSRTISMESVKSQLRDALRMPGNFHTMENLRLLVALWRNHLKPARPHSKLICCRHPLIAMTARCPRRASSLLAAQSDS